MSGTRPPAELRLQIESIDADGLGLAPAGARQVRVKNGLPGELLRARMLKRGRRGWLMEAIEVTQPSVHRRSPPCGNFPRCGGCMLQHLDYPAQLELKQRRLLDALESVGVTPARVRAPVRGPMLHYRTKARFGVRVVNGEVLVGYRESYSAKVMRMSDCSTLIHPFARLIEPIRRLISDLSRPDAIPQIELAAGERQHAMVVRHLAPLTAADSVLLQRFADHHRLTCYVQSGGYDSVEAISPGDPYLGYANPDLGLYFQFLPWEFTQINLPMNRSLVRNALLSLAPGRNARVIDLFCGIGNFSLALARLGAHVLAYENNPQAVVRARQNARLNGLEARCEFVLTDLYDAAGRRLEEAEFLLLDPPRSGAGPNLRRWLEDGRIRRVAYVSCEPKSFAADARVLAAAGFVLEQVGIYDMFPHTTHVETLGVFDRTW